MSNRYPSANARRKPLPDYRRPTQPRTYPRRPLPRSPTWYPSGPRTPLPYSVPSPVTVGRYTRAFAGAFRFLPWINGALLAYELYNAYSWWQEQSYSPQPDGVFKCEPPPEPPRYYGTGFTYLSNTSGFCSEQYAHPPGSWSPSTPWFARYGVRDTGAPLFDPRWAGHTALRYDTDPGMDPIEVPEGPLTLPIPVPEIPFIPWIDPLSPPQTPMPHPLRPPVRRPWPRPYNPEDPQGWTNPEIPPGTVSNTPRTRSEPPGRGVKERKVRFRSNVVARRFLGLILSVGSEVGDFVDSLYDALPDHLKGKNPNMKQKLELLYKHINEVDMNKAMENIWKNEVEDRYMGKLLGDISKEMEEYGLETGMLRT